MQSTNAWLECPTTGKQFPVGEFALVGRGPTAAVRLPDGSVSREHASLWLKGRVWWVQDMGSANGTFVNGLPAGQGTQLANGDNLLFGSAHYVFRTKGDDSRPVAVDVMERTIVARPGDGTAAVTLLVADVMGFSELSNRVAAPELSRAMSGWCEHVRTVLQNHGAHIDKFIGDCVFAWWHGTSAAVKSRAVQAGSLLAGGFPETGLPDGTTLRCGVGLHAGEAALSRLGPSSYTLLGAEVNFVFRLESLTRRLEQVLASKAFASQWPAQAEWDFAPLGTHEIKGWDQPVEVYGIRHKS